MDVIWHGANRGRHSFFLAAQKSFPSVFRDNIYSLGDDDYDAYNYTGKGESLLTGYDTSISGGDACEDSIMRFLYQLWNKQIGTGGELCSEKELWLDVIYANESYGGMENFNQFYQYLSSHHSDNILEKLASTQQIAVSQVGMKASSTACPTLSWDGSNVLWDERNNIIEKYKFRIHVFSDIGCKIKVMDLNGNDFISESHYTLSKDEFRFLSGDSVYIKIEKITYEEANGASQEVNSYESKGFNVIFPEYEND